MIKTFRKLILASFFLFIAPEAHAQMQLRTCKVGNVIYTEDTKGTKCIQPLTPAQIKLLFGVAKALTPPPKSEEYQKNENFCQIYVSRNDSINQMKYCGALSAMGSLAATDIMCKLHFNADSSSKETDFYCQKSSDSDRLVGHFYSYFVKLRKGDNETAIKYLYRAVDRSFFYNKNPTRLERVFGAPQNDMSKLATEMYLTFAGENLLGASLASLGFPEIQIQPSFSIIKNRRNYLSSEDWISSFDSSGMDEITTPKMVRFAIFTVPASGYNDLGDPSDEAKPIMCYFKDEAGKLLRGDQYNAACGYMAYHGKFIAGVDVDGKFAPAFVYGTAVIKQGEVVLMN